jgi:hypothetical protein
MRGGETDSAHAASRFGALAATELPKKGGMHAPPAKPKQTAERVQLKAHRFAERYPAMEGDRLDEFVADILKNGQRDPIILY